MRPGSPACPTTRVRSTPGRARASEQPVGPDPDGYDPEAPFERAPTPVDGRPREHPAAYWAQLVANTDPDDLRVQPGPEGRAVVRRVRRLRDDGDELQPVPGQLRTTVRQRLAAVRSRLVGRQAADTPIEQLRDAMTGRVHLGTLEAHGYRSVRDVARADPEELDALPRVDTHTAEQAVVAARLAMEGMDDDVTVRLDPDQRDRGRDPPAGRRLALRPGPAVGRRVGRGVHRVPVVGRPAAAPRGPGVAPVPPVLSAARPATAGWPPSRSSTPAWPTSGPAAWPRPSPPPAGCWPSRQPGDDELWRDYERRPVEVNMLLAGIGRADSEADEAARVEATGGYVPAELAERVRRHELDTSC